MALVVVCPSCKQKLTFPDMFAGREVQCPGCMSDVKVTTENRVPDAPAKPAARPAAPSAPTGTAVTGNAAGTNATPLKPAATPPPSKAPVKKPAVSDSSANVQKRPAQQPAARKPIPAKMIVDDEGDDGLSFDSPNRPRQKSSGGKKAFVFILILLLLGGAGVGGYFVYQNMNKEEGKGGPIASSDKDKGSEARDKADKDGEKDKGAVEKDKEVDRDRDKKIDKDRDKDKDKDKKDSVLAKAGGEVDVTGRIAFDKRPRGLVTDPEGKFAYVLFDDSSIHRLDLTDRSLAEAIPPHPRKTLNLGTFAMSRDGKWIARSLDNHGIDVFNVATREAANLVREERAFYGPMNFSPDGTKLYVPMHSALHCIDIASKKSLFTCKTREGHEILPPSYGLSPDGKLIFATGNRSDIYVFDASNGQSLYQEQFEKDGSEHCRSGIVFSADGKRVAGEWLGKIRTWHMPSLKQRPVFDPSGGVRFSNIAMGALFLKDSDRIAVHTNTGKVYLYDVLTGQRRAVLKDKGNFAYSGLQLAMGGKMLIALHNNDFVYWDLDTVPLDPPDTLLAAVPDSTEIVRLDPRKDPGPDPGPGPKPGPAPGKMEINPSKDYRLTLVGKTQPFIEGFVLLDHVLLLTEGPKQLVIWEPGRNSAYELSMGTAYISAFEKYAQRLITLSVAEKPPTDEYGRFILENPTIARYDANAAIIGTAKASRPLPAKDKATLKGKVVQMECMGNTLVYLDVADAAKPMLRWIDPAIFSQIREVAAPAGTVAFRITEKNEWHCLTRDGTLHVFSSLKNVWLGEETLRITPYDLVTAKGVSYISGTRDGVPGILRARDIPRKETTELFISGLADKLKLRTGEDGFLFALAPTADKVELFGLHPTKPEGSLSLVYGMSKGGPSNGRYVISRKFVLVDNGDVFALTRADEKVAMLDGKKEMPGFPDPFPPKGKDPFAKGKDPFMPKVPGGGVGEPINLLGKVEPFTGGWIDPDNKGAILIHKSILKSYTYPEFRPKVTWKLTGGSTRVAFDKARGVMYVLSPNLKVDPTGIRGASQLRIYDVMNVMTDMVKPTVTKDTLTPTQTVALPGFCTQLLIAPDGESLYALENKENKAARALRLNTKGEITGETPLHPLSDAMVLTADGKTLHVISHTASRVGAKPGSVTGILQTIETAGMKGHNTEVAIDPNDVEATSDGVVFLSGYGPGKLVEMLVVDLSRKDSPVTATWKGIPPASCLRLDEAGRRLYVRSTRNNPSIVFMLPLPDNFADSELPRSPWSNGPTSTLRGEFLVAPDARLLLCESGQVYRIGNPDPFGGGLGGFPAP